MGQKLNAVATVLAFGGFIATGLLLTFWPNTAVGAASPLVTPAGLHRVALALHVLLALASVALLAGHVLPGCAQPGNAAQPAGDAARAGAPRVGAALSGSWLCRHAAPEKEKDPAMPPGSGMGG